MRRAVFAILIAIAVAVAFAPCAFAQTPKDTYTLTPKTMAPVTFNHKAHSSMPDAKCDTCHVSAKGGVIKPAVAPETNPFHKKMAKGGLCIDCHAKEKAAGKKVPSGCTDCHKKKA